MYIQVVSCMLKGTNNSKTKQRIVVMIFFLICQAICTCFLSRFGPHLLLQLVKWETICRKSFWIWMLRSYVSQWNWCLLVFPTVTHARLCHFFHLWLLGVLFMNLIYLVAVICICVFCEFIVERRNYLIFRRKWELTKYQKFQNYFVNWYFSI